jgi:hypothetical protein
MGDTSRIEERTQGAGGGTGVDDPVGFVGGAVGDRIAQGYHLYNKELKREVFFIVLYVPESANIMRARQNQFGIAVFRDVALHRPKGIGIPTRKEH